MQPSSQNLGLPMNLGLIKDRATTEGRDIFFPWATGQFESPGIQLLSAQAKGAAAFEEGKSGSRDSCTVCEDIVSSLKRLLLCPQHQIPYVTLFCGGLNSEEASQFL